MNETPLLSPNPPQRPGLVTTLAVITMANGILNLLLSLTITTLIVIGTIGIGLVFCAPVTLLPAVLGVFEIIYAARLFSEVQLPPRPNRVLAYFEIAAVLFANLISLGVGIIALVIYDDAEVKAYFNRAA